MTQTALAAAARAVCLCGNDRFDTVFDYREPPVGEVRFAFSGGGGYRREVLRCTRCGHFLSVHDMDTSKLYEGAYVDATYGGDGLRRAFDRIVALDPGRSDNVGRVSRVVAHARSHFGAQRADGPLTILDVGSGLCVFLHRVHATTPWVATALDPDERAAQHARDCAGVNAICGDFMRITPPSRFDMVSFNKVLEHVTDPVAMLRHALGFLAPGGFIYVELPDGEAAQAEGPGREEFFIDHHHVFSLASIRVLAARAGFRCDHVERLREPSTKFTLRAFLSAPAEGTGARA